MLHTYRFVVFLLFGVVLALPRLAAAQSAAAQDSPISLRDLNELPGGQYFEHSLAVQADFPQALFRHMVLDSALRPRHLRELKLNGFGVALAGYGLNRQAALYQFRRRGSDSLVSVVADTAGRVLSVRRERRDLPPARWQRETQLLPSDSLFLLTEVSRKSRRILVRCLDLQQRERWQLTLTPERGRDQLLTVAAGTQYVWLVNASNSRSRRTEHTALCVALATGQTASSTPLDYQGERRVASRSLLGADHTLTLVGRAYHHRRISRVHSGDLFVTRLAPDGSRQLDRTSPLGTQPGLLGTHRAKTYWQSLTADPAGNLRLVGQSFTSTSWGGNFAIGVATGIATLGLVRVSFTTLRPRDLVSLQFDPQGGLTKARMMPLPEAGSYTTGGYVPAQSIAELAEQAGVLPLRGLTPDGRLAVLRTRRQLYLLDLDTQQPRLLRDSHALGDADVWQVRGNQVLLFRPNDNFSRQFSLERVAY